MIITLHLKITVQTPFKSEDNTSTKKNNEK